MTRPIFILVLFFVSPFWGMAQDDSTLIELDEVVIKSNRIELPFSENSRTIEVISRQQIERTPAQSIPELLQYVAGVDIRQRGVHGVQADVSLRGGTFDQVLILVNGIKMSDPQTGHHSLNIPLSLSNIERIEILKGPAARIYGQNAFTGAINIVTKTPDESFIEVGVQGGQHELGGLTASIALAGEKWKQYASASRNVSDGYRFNTDYDITNYFYQADYQMAANQEIQILGSFTERKFGANRFYGNNSEVFANQYEEVQTSLVALGYRLAKGKFIFRPRISWRRNQDEYVFIRDNPAVYRNLHISQVINLEIHADYYSDLGITGIGAEWQKVHLQSNNLGQRDRDVATIFAEHRFSFLHDEIDLTPGVSFSHYSDFGSYFYPGIELGYRPSYNTKFYANTGYTWRIPTFTDLYYEDAANLGNEALEPEAAISYEIGAQYQKGMYRGQISAFLRDGKDLIDWTRADADAKWQPINVTQVKMQGIEWSSNLDFTQLWGKQSWLQEAHFSYTYIDAEDPQNEAALSRYVLENLNHQLIAGLEHRIVGKLYHQVRFRYLDRVSMEDYAVLDLRLAWRSKKWQAFIQMDNVIDTKYLESNLVEMPRSWLYGGVQYTFNYGK